jgi:hypothetical protein
LEKKIKTPGKNQDGVMWTIFSTKNQLKLHLAAVRVSKKGKRLFEILKFAKMTKKFKMVSETFIFLILLSKLQFSTDFKNLECIRSVFLSFFFQKSKMVAHILRKSRLFFKRVLPTLNSTFSNSQKTIL